MKRILFAGAAAAAALAGSIALAAPAMASSNGHTVVASTHVAGVPDTTVGNTGFYEDGTGHITQDPTKSVYGSVWAIDDATDTYHVTPLGNNQYKVDRMVNGTFAAFAQPNSGQPLAPALSTPVDGQFHGTISYVVTSANGPDASKLPAEEPMATGSHAQLEQLFPGLTEAGISGGGDWVFAYHAAGGSMTQRYDTDPTTWGNITS